MICTKCNLMLELERVLLEIHEATADGAPESTLQNLYTDYYELRNEIDGSIHDGRQPHHIVSVGVKHVRK